jgi:RNA polymerase sigma-70 factor, ECF subfamily
MYSADIALESGFQVAGEEFANLATDADAEFSALVQRQSQFAFKVAYAVLLNSYDAEDAVQETFLRLYRNRGWERAENERAYLARVAWRVAIDLKRRVASSSSASDSAAFNEIPSTRPDPEESLAAATEHAAIHALINSLSEDLRIPLVLSTFEEFNSREIGEILGIPEGTVRTRLQRARQILRQKLASRKETRYV